jgi:hypothetical protein
MSDPTFQTLVISLLIGYTAGLATALFFLINGGGGGLQSGAVVVSNRQGADANWGCLLILLCVSIAILVFLLH